jgi:basic membrane protein A
LTEATTDVAGKYPAIYFIGIDQQPEKGSPNLTGLTFPDDEAGFLVGALAAQLTQSGKVGGIFASDVIPYIWKFGEGYRAGALYINPNIQVLVSYHNDVATAASFSDPEWGAATSLSFIEQGADIICGGGGTTGNGAVVGAVQGGVLGIGFNTDQYYTLPEAQKGLLSSAIKMITPGVYTLIKAARDGEFSGGIVTGEIGYAPFHRVKDRVSDEVKAKMEEIRKGLIDGTLKTNVPVTKP